jgi:type VII secretion protein EccB
VAEESDGLGGAEKSRRRLGRGLGYATRVQVSAHQFMARRTALAMTRRQTRMESEPGRREWMAMLAGLATVLVICVGALFWSIIRPAGSAGTATIIADQDSDALYVRVGQRLYPVLNLASARLIAGEAQNPVRVRRSEIDSMPRGPMAGIPGAPMTAMTATQPEKSSWLVCDTVTKAFGAGAPEPVTVTVVDGQPDLNEHRRVLEKPDGVLLRFGTDVWLIRDGRRSLVDASERPVLLALGVSGDQLAAARPMSQALLNAIPVAPPLGLPVIPGAGGPAQFPGAPGPVGMVVSTPQVGGDSTYSVVVPTGMQTISPIVAQILQNAGGMAGSVPVVAGQKLSALPTVHVIDTSIYPDERLRVVDTQNNPSTCWWWQKTAGETQAQTSVISGASVPVPSEHTAAVVKMVNATKDPGQANEVYLESGYANYVVSTGNDPSAATNEALWWISESGARFGVQRDQDTLRALGFSTPPSPAPWVVLRLLAPGPMLTRSDAEVLHDTLPSDGNPGRLDMPK